MSKQVNRRTFLTMGAAAGTGLALMSITGCSGQSNAQLASESTAKEQTAAALWRTRPEPVDESSIVNEYSADVVIVGAGQAGTCAARAAAEEGASVIVLEAQQKESFMVFASEYGSINAQFSSDRGLPTVDTVVFRQDWMRRNLNRSNPLLIKQFAEESGATFDWFIEPLDEGFKNSLTTFRPSGPAGEVNGYHNFLGTNIFRGSDETHDYSLKAALLANQAAAESAGAEFHFETKGYYLEKDAEGKVNAVIASSGDESYIRYSGRKGVLLTAGDFAGNPEMVEDLLSELVALNKSEPLMGFTWDGSGIQMGVWAGGLFDPSPSACLGGATAGEAGPFSASPFLRLNSDGMRFSSESVMGEWGFGFQAARQPDGIISAVFDSNWEENLRKMPCDHGSIDMDNKIIADRLIEDMGKLQSGPEGGDVRTALTSDEGEAKTVYKADTLEDLATYLGYEGKSKDNFLASIERYNGFCDAGVDEDFVTDPSAMYPVKDAPFYGIAEEKTLSGIVTMTGLMIDKDHRVLDNTMNAIPGLYAAGNNSGCRFAASYSTPVGGCSVGIAQTLGRAAGRTIARS